MCLFLDFGSFRRRNSSGNEGVKRVKWVHIIRTQMKTHCNTFVGRLRLDVRVTGTYARQTMQSYTVNTNLKIGVVTKNRLNMFSHVSMLGHFNLTQGLFSRLTNACWHRSDSWVTACVDLWCDLSYNCKRARLIKACPASKASVQVPRY